ncbi:aminotransferase [Halobacteriales archaeon QS_1_67_19]|nr:MAG: aminotransferase [Halobacteriales archaeon QS_1_67_19]
MDIAPFELERWFAEYEHGADIMLAESGIRSLDARRFDLDPGKLGYVIPTNGDPEFRAAIADRYDREADEALFTCGTQEANFLAFLSLLGGQVGGGDHAVVVTPTYQALHAVPEAVGDVTRVWLDPPEWELDVDAVADAIRPETSVIVLNNPNNPTGRYHPRSKVRALYDLAEDSDAYLLCDEVYRLLAEDPLPPVASMGERGISTTSLTKAYGLAGLRFGWLAGPREVVEAARQWKDYTTISPSIFGQHVARQALGDREDAILEENRELAAHNRERVREFVASHDLSWYDPVGVNGFVSVPDGFEGSDEFCRTVVEDESVVLAPGELFGYDDYFRIGFGLPTDELAAGLSRVSSLIERHRNN